MKTNDITTTLSEALSENNVGNHVDSIIRETRLPASMIAMGLGISEKNLNRIRKKRNRPRQESIRPIGRVQTLLEEAYEAMSPKGAVEWLKKPNPYLNDVPPILCLRSDKEMEKVISLLSAIKFGLPA